MGNQKKTDQRKSRVYHLQDPSLKEETQFPEDTSGTIKPRKSSRTSKGGFIDYDYFDRETKELKGETIERSIQWYRMWFLFLKLGLEYKKKKIKVNNEYVKIDRKFYKEWSVKTIPNRTFDNWWKDHRHLFIQEQIQIIKEISKKNKQDYFHIRIPKHRNQRELFKELSIFLQGKMKGDKPKYPFSSNRGGVQYLKLHQQYNCLILFQNGGTGKQIINWINDQYEHITHKEVVGSPQSMSRTLKNGRDRLHRTSRGVFP